MLKKLEDCTVQEVRAYGEITLGLEIPRTANLSIAIARVKAARPDLTEIEVADAKPTVYADASQAAAMDAQLPPAVDLAPLVGGAMPHPSTDPKVELTVNKTTEHFRPKDVTIGVNGETWRMKRGERVRVPYRVFEALDKAIEKQAVDTGEVNDFGIAKREWQDVHSYPFQVHSMPSDAEIAAWRARTDDAVSSPYAQPRRAA